MKYVKFFSIALIMILLFGCAGKTVYVDRVVEVPKSEVQNPQPNHNQELERQRAVEAERARKQQLDIACNNFYIIYRASYDAGVGKDEDFCVNLAKQIFQANPMKVVEDMNLKISKFCGLACIQGSRGQSVISYVEFQEIFEQSFGN